MAKILKSEEQEIALLEIQSMITAVKDINSVLGTVDGKKYTVQNAACKKVSVEIEDGFNAKIEAALLLQRSKYIKNIEDTAKKYKIGLDEDDEKALGDEAVACVAPPAKKKRRGKAEQEPEDTENESDKEKSWLEKPLDNSHSSFGA